MKQSPRTPLTLGAYWNARLEINENEDVDTLRFKWGKTIKRAMDTGARGCVVARLINERDFIMRGITQITSPRVQEKQHTVDKVYDAHTHTLLEDSAQTRLQRIVQHAGVVACLGKLKLDFWFQTESRGRGLLRDTHILPDWLELYVYWTPQTKGGALYAYWLGLMAKGSLYESWVKRIKNAMCAGQRVVALFVVQKITDYRDAKKSDDNALRVPSVRAYLTLEKRPDELTLNVQHASLVTWLTQTQGLNWALLVKENCEVGVFAVHRM